MSNSKIQIFSNKPYDFPYCNYPYTRMDKIKYYAGNFYCAAVSMFGIGIYARFLDKSYITNNDLPNMKNSDLAIKISCAISNAKWNVGNIVIGVLMAVPCYFVDLGKFITNFDHVSNYGYVFGWLAVIINSYRICGLMSNLHNYIRANQQISANNHGIKIQSAKRALIKEFSDSLTVSKSEFSDPNGNEINEIIYVGLNKQKLEWDLHEYPINNNTTVSYIVANVYYQDLWYLFEMKEMAESFRDHLKQFDIEYVDRMAGNKQLANNVRVQYSRENVYYRYIESILGEIS